MIFPGLDGSFGSIVVVNVRGNELESDVVFGKGGCHRGGTFVVEDV